MGRAAVEAKNTAVMLNGVPGVRDRDGVKHR